MVLRRFEQDAGRLFSSKSLDGVSVKKIGAGPVPDGDDLSPAFKCGRGGGVTAVELSGRDRRRQRGRAARAAEEAAAFGLVDEVITARPEEQSF